MLHLPTAPHGRTRGIPVAQGGGAGTLMPRVGARGGETPAHGARVMPRTGPAHTCGDGSEQGHVAPTHCVDSVGPAVGAPLRQLPGGGPEVGSSRLGSGEPSLDIPEGPSAIHVL